MILPVLLLLAQVAPPPVVVAPPAPAASGFDGRSLYESVLRDRGMSAEGARLIARDPSEQALMDERRAREIALAERLAMLAAASAVDVDAFAALVRERDALATEYGRRYSDIALAQLARLSPADRKVYAPMLVFTRGGFRPVAPPAPPPRPSR